MRRTGLEVLGPPQHGRLNEDWRLCVCSDEGDVAELELVEKVRAIRDWRSLSVGSGDLAGDDKLVLDA